MKNCPKCKLPIHEIFDKDSEIICSLCGEVYASAEYMAQAKKVDFKIRFWALIVFWIVFTPVGLYSRSNPSAINAHNQSIIVFGILLFAIGINILASFVTKKKFPEIKVD